MSLSVSNLVLENLLLPVLPLRDALFFPGEKPPLFVGREKSINALEDAMSQGKKLLLVAQRDSFQEDFVSEDLYTVGVISHIVQLLKLPDGAIKVIVEVEKRVRVLEYREQETFMQALVEEVHEAEDAEDGENEHNIEALRRSIVTGVENYIKLNKKVLKADVSFVNLLMQHQDPYRFTDAVASDLDIKVSDKQEILEIFEILPRMEKVYALLSAEIGVLNIEQRIRHRVKSQVENTQKVYYLNEQIKAIQKELGENDINTEANDLGELNARISKMSLSAEAKEKVEGEIKKLKMMAPMSAEATVIRNYLDWVLGMPWGKRDKIKTDLIKGQEVLESNHHGMSKVKERILEHLAVHKRTKKLRGPILCLLGAPGVGKTSLAQSMAEATGRKFIRMSLGGVRDESEVRGHRRTYIGSMPGKIIQYLKKVKSSNPLLLLDEIDKIGADHRGDPAAALLEVLDSEHNKHFVDHYLEVEFDLSEVMFVATANTLNIPRPLLDRMEVIRVSGYTENEKINIANKYLIDNLKKEHGLKEREVSISHEALVNLIRYYTRESGVRSLKRELANLMRKSVREILTKEKKTKINITISNLKKFSGVKKYMFGQAEQDNLVGIVTGLAYTEVGGDILTIESVMMPGKGNIRSTGKLGEVMQESVQTAYSYIRSRCLAFGITSKTFQKYDIHLHAPEGATPKDGPSAGVAICISIISVLTGIPIDATVAMTGEITLRGRVLEIGGLKEKLLSALRSGITTVLIPQSNEKDLEEMPANVKKGLKIIPISYADEAINIALVRQPMMITEDEIYEEPRFRSDDNSGDNIKPVQH